jgi:cell division protein YceG involved in septum cleavage
LEPLSFLKEQKKIEEQAQTIEKEKTEEQISKAKKQNETKEKPKNLEGWLWRKSLNILHGYQVSGP